MTTEPRDRLAESRERKEADIQSAERSVREGLVKVRRALGLVEEALDKGHRVYGGVSGRPFVASDAEDLVEAISRRQRAYEEVAEFDYLLGLVQADAYGLTDEERDAIQAAGGSVLDLDHDDDGSLIAEILQVEAETLRSALAKVGGVRVPVAG